MNNIASNDSEHPLTSAKFPSGFFPGAELVFALVCPLGTDHQRVAATLANYLNQFGYETNNIRLSESFEELSLQLGLIWNPPTDRAERAHYKIQAGNLIREKTQQMDIFALASAALICDKRLEQLGEIEEENELKSLTQPLVKTAHIITTLKRPEEVDTLRRIYGTGFFLIGLASPKNQRDAYFLELGIENDAAQLMEKDEAEPLPHGQKTRETFHLSDVFISMDDFGPQIARFLDLIFGCPKNTPTPDEQGMFMAYAASLRSGDLARQVGAAIVDQNGDLLSVGCNEVPKYGGGLYGPGDGSNRDIERGVDSNDLAKSEMILKIQTALKQDDITVDQLRTLLKPTGLMDLTEFGRSVHAEMDALLTCARTSRSPRGATLFTTTFPCHNCCRHLIAAGIEKVVYIEPYAKSRASTLHSDAISIDSKEEGKLPFTPFIGVGPRRYFDLFSLKLSTGYPIERKDQKGKITPWDRKKAPPRLQMQPNSYLERESFAWRYLKDILS